MTPLAAVLHSRRTGVVHGGAGGRASRVAGAVVGDTRVGDLGGCGGALHYGARGEGGLLNSGWSTAATRPRSRRWQPPAMRLLSMR